jgi:YihY family inner membrane protein
VSEVLNSERASDGNVNVQAETPAGGSTETVRETEVETPVVLSKWYRWRKDGTALVRYLLDSEVHTFAFSVAANAILSFIPFIKLLFELSKNVFHSETMKAVVNDIAKDFLPATLKDQDFWLNGLGSSFSRHSTQFFSLFMILIACTGIFLPLEVALNQAWGVTKSRNYLANQVVAFGLAILMVVLGMSCVMVNAAFRLAENSIFPNGLIVLGLNVTGGVAYILLAITTGIASILFFFAVYWLLPNRKVPPQPVIRTAVVTGLIWLAARYVFALVLPHLDLHTLYGPFYVSVGLIFWAYTSGLILFAGAQFSVARMGNRQKE